MSDDTHVTPAEEIIAARGAALPVTLPDSGWTVAIRKVSLMELVAAGRVPEDLGHAALTSLAEALDEARNESPKEARRSVGRRIDVVNAVCCAILVNPAMSPDATEGAITPDDLPMDDRLHLYGLATGAVKGPKLARFPDGPGAGVAVGADGAGVGSEAVDSPRGR